MNLNLRRELFDQIGRAVRTSIQSTNKSIDIDEYNEILRKSKYHSKICILIDNIITTYEEEVKKKATSI